MTSTTLLGIQTPLPECAGKYRGRLLVCGSSKTLWDDLACVPPDWTCDTLAVNWAGVFLPRRLSHWVSIHGRMLSEISKCREFTQRALDKRAPKTIYHSVNPRPEIDFAWKDTVGQDSGLFGVRIGLLLGYEEIVLAGIPNEDLGYFYFAPQDPKYQLTSRGRWHEFRGAFAGRVKSLSGWTARAFGLPEWGV